MLDHLKKFRVFLKDDDIFIIRRHFPLGWIIYYNGEYIDNCAWKDRLDDIILYLLSKGYVEDK